MDDPELIKNCLRGDKDSWNHFIDKYSRLVYSCIYSVIKIRGKIFFKKDNIEEIFQNFFLSLLKDNCKKLRSFKGKNGCTFSSWLRLVAVSSTIDFMRKQRPFADIDQLDENDFALNKSLGSYQKIPDEQSDMSERMGNLHHCIEELRADEKYFLELHMNQGVQLEDLKRYFKISRGALDMRKARILNKLRDCFRRKGFFK